jgi:hypothetical protein
MSTCLACALVTREHALKISEPSYVPRAAKLFFIPMAYSVLRAVGHMAAPELSPQEGRVWSREARDSAGALPCGEAGSGTEGHVAAPEPTSTRRWGPEPRDRWQR